MFHSPTPTQAAVAPPAPAPEITPDSPTKDLLTLAGFETRSRQERWRLIDIIEQRIDRLQEQQRQAAPQTIGFLFLGSQIQGLRLKRFAIWNSFYPQFSAAIRVGLA